VRDPRNCRLANRFVLTANIEASDGGKAIIAGNERVIRARLSDALYFWQTDQKPLPDFETAAAKPLDQRMAKLRALNVVFHEKLGTQGERVDRISELAFIFAHVTGGEPSLARRAAEICKADLMTEVVGEFPEVQGLMGRQYALLQREDPEVASAIEDHYRPQGISDDIPIKPVSTALALADKLDTLSGFWRIGETPTGSKDPFALRRAALGVIRILLRNGISIPLRRMFAACLIQHEVRILESKNRELGDISLDDARSQSNELLQDIISRRSYIKQLRAISLKDGEAIHLPATLDAVSADLLSFFHDRLKVLLRDQGQRHDLVDAVLASGEGNDDLLLVVRRVEALAALLCTEDGKNLLAGTKRAINILRIEEKKDGRAHDGAPDAALVEAKGLPEEKALFAELQSASARARDHVGREDYAGAMKALAELRPAVDAFFDKVTVNADDPALRENRLRILGQLRAATATVADFSKIEG